jgi:hypothetical protein
MTELSRARERALILSELYGAAEAARRTGVSTWSIYHWADRRRRGLPLASGGNWNPPVDAMLRLSAQQLSALRKRAFQGCRCEHPAPDALDGCCWKCGHPWSWPVWRATVRETLCYLAAGSAETEHEHDPEAVFA